MKSLTLRSRAGVTALVILAVVLPYWRLILGLGIVVPDDGTISDFYDAEFAVRVALGRMLRSGRLPVWLSGVHCGLPAGLGDPLSAVLFTVLPPVFAVNLLILTALCIAALGARALGDRLSMSPWGSALTAVSFAWSGYLVCQLRHLGILLTVCWAPLGLALIDRALSGSSPLGQSARVALGFTCVFAMQLAAGFPQSAYILGMLYAGFAVFRAASLPRREGLVGLTWLFLGCCVALLLAMYQLFGLWEFGRLSTRAQGVSAAWAQSFHYNPRAIVTFLWPYALGDASEGTYTQGTFWEDYGYVGIAPLALGAYALSRGTRKASAWFFALAAGLSYLMVLGPATPVFRWAFELVPGMKLFRLPTRFLVVTDLSLCVLGGLGLSDLSEALEGRVRASLARAFSPAVLGLAVMNLWWVQPRQNPVGEAREWMSPPATARVISRDSGLFRVFTLDPHGTHAEAHEAAGGWQNLAPLLSNREFLSPDSNLLWGIDAADGYSGLYTRNTAWVWGSPNGDLGLVQRSLAGGVLSHGFFALMGLHNVKYILSRWRLEAPELEYMSMHGRARLYRVRDPLPRAWMVSGARRVASNAQAGELLLSEGFDPRREVLLHAAGASEAYVAGPRGEVRVRAWASGEIFLSVRAENAGWLVLSEGAYPGWEATVDGRPTEVFRANINSMALRLPAGRHELRMSFRAEALWLGLRLSAVGLCLFALGVALTRRKAS